MSVKDYSDVLLNHPEFAVIGDATSLVNPSNDSFFSRSFGDNAETASDDSPSTVGHADSLPTDSLDGFGITVDELFFTFDFDDLDGTTDATSYAELTNADAGSDFSSPPATAMAAFKLPTSP
jgi:hypothetical protein